MPTFPPSRDLLLNRRITGFAIDTQAYQAHGFRFWEGALAVLPRQIPPWVSLVSTEVVEREMSAHIKAALDEDIKRMYAAVDSLARKHGVSLPDALGKQLKDLELEAASTRARDEFRKALRMRLLPLSSRLSVRDLLERYFVGRPPFASGNKKAEFPDAFSLMALEADAIKRQQLYICVSEDSGWLDFCEQSSHLYCAKTLRDLTALYSSKDAPDSLLKFIEQGFDDAESVFYADASKAVSAAFVGKRFPLAMRTNSGFFSIADIVEVKGLKFKEHFSSPQVWIMGGDDDTAVVSTTAAVDADVVLEVDDFPIDPSHSSAMGTRLLRGVTSVEEPIYFRLTGLLSGESEVKVSAEFHLSRDDLDVK